MWLNFYNSAVPILALGGFAYFFTQHMLHFTEPRDKDGDQEISTKAL